MLWHASRPQLIQVEALVAHVLDRVDASEVGHDETVLAQLGDLVGDPLVRSVLLKLASRPPVDRLDRPPGESGLLELIVGEAELLELLDDAGGGVG